MLTIEGDYPISVSLNSQGNHEYVLENYAASNTRLLRALNLFELSGHGVVPEINVDAAGELARIEAKLDIVLGLMGEWLASRDSLPPVRHLWLSVDKLAVVVTESFAEGETLSVELYPSAQLPRALRFLCAVDRLIEEPERTIMELSIRHPDGATVDDFERFVFLLHRRQLSPHIAPRIVDPR